MNYKYVFHDKSKDYIRVIIDDGDYWYNILDLGRCFGVSKSYVSEYFKFSGDKFVSKNKNVLSKYVDIYDIKTLYNKRLKNNNFIVDVYNFLLSLKPSDFLEKKEFSFKFDVDKFLSTCCLEKDNNIYFRYSKVGEFFNKSSSWYFRKFKDIKIDSFLIENKRYMDLENFKKLLSLPVYGKDTLFEKFISFVMSKDTLSLKEVKEFLSD